MSSDIDRAIDALFPGDKSVETANVKFFHGDRRPLKGDELMDQLSRADAQVNAGIAKPIASLDGDMVVTKI
jgi:hypothetical protein